MLPFASTWHIFHTPILGTGFVVGYCFGDIVIIILFIIILISVILLLLVGR